MLTEFDKITIIGDIHGRTIWEKIVEKENDSITLGFEYKLKEI